LHRTTASAVTRRLSPGAILPSLALVIFDCDGVLIDSEPLGNRVVAEELSRIGWPMDGPTCQAMFLGLTYADVQRVTEHRLERTLGEDWVDRVVARVSAVMAREATAIPGAFDAVKAVAAMGLPIRVASNSSHEEMAAKFACTGLDRLIPRQRIHSAHDLIARGRRGKPDPDLFLEAAAAEGVSPLACLVVEDSLAGARAAAAAGMSCLGFTPDRHGPDLESAGALPFSAMAALPDLIRARLDRTA
jgi:HAD superfamily hydrolase (TIGR01509 family)